MGNWPCELDRTRADDCALFRLWHAPLITDVIKETAPRLDVVLGLRVIFWPIMESEERGDGCAEHLPVLHIFFELRHIHQDAGPFLRDEGPCCVADRVSEITVEVAWKCCTCLVWKGVGNCLEGTPELAHDHASCELALHHAFKDDLCLNCAKINIASTTELALDHHSANLHTNSLGHRLEQGRSERWQEMLNNGHVNDAVGIQVCKALRTGGVDLVDLPEKLFHLKH
mmetsp:Transcript_50342/g.118214  ORF Transcript_50342/g.118214 Transcript_50342/m.118214 type:complete len:228 (+) Transcript_50342:317-1000(+)